jgi:signal transduction histidine kinase
MELPTPERISVARELHDGIAQDLVGIGYSLDLLLAESSLDNSARSQIRKTRLEIDSLISKVRAEILRLRQPMERSFLSQLESLILAQRFSAEISLDCQELDLSPTQRTELVAIVSEILRNVERHSGATHVAIAAYPINNRTCLEVRDNGIGGAQMHPGHYGLQGITERVESLGGSIDIKSLEGTHITILI